MTRCLSCGRRYAGLHPGCPSRQAEPSAPPAVPVVDGFVVEGLLGRGGFGVVARARDVTGRRVALKVAAPGPGTASLAHELEALLSIGAPLAPALLGRGELKDGSSYLALEFLEGSPLNELLERHELGLPVAELKTLATSLLDVVAGIHERGWLHLDLKPENAMLAGDGSIRWLDFGNARSQVEAARGGRVAGTAEYMSPEQVEGGPLDVRSEVSSLTAVLFELTTGRTPFFGGETEVHQAHRSLRPPRASTLAPGSPQLDEVFARGLAKLPSERFADVRSLKDAFLGALAEAPREARPSSPGAALPSSSVKRTMALVFIPATREPARVKAVLARSGGSLAHSAPDGAVAVFDAEQVDHPVRRALRAAQALLQDGVSTSACVDLAPVSAQKRPDGTVRYVSALFGKKERYPTRPGVVVTDDAAHVLDPASLARSEDGAHWVLQRRPEAAAVALATTPTRLGVSGVVGRDEPLTQAAQLGRTAIRDKRPTLVSVRADAGLGKTAFASALVDRLFSELPGVRVLSLVAREVLTGEVDDLVLAVLRHGLALDPLSLDAQTGRSALQSALGPRTAEQVYPAVALSLGWLSADHPDVQQTRRVPGAIAAGVTRALAELLRREPTALLLDDAHLASAVFLDAVELTALSEDGAAFFGCMLARPSFDPGRPRFGSRAAAHQRFTLEPLSEHDADVLIRQLLRPAEKVPTDVVSRLVERTRGSPLLIVELVRGLKAQGLVQRAARGDSYFVSTDVLDQLPPLPAIEWLAQREVSALSPALSSHAQLVALLGPSFSTQELEAVLRVLEDRGLGAQFPLDARASIDELIAARVLVPAPSGTSRFKQSVVRDAVVATIPPALQRAIHEAAAVAYDRPGVLTEVAQLARRAHHLDASGQGAAAVPLFVALAERALQRHQYLDAEQMFSRALAHLGDAASTERLAALRHRGLTRYRLARYDDSRTDLARARALAEALDDREALLEVLLEEATALDWMTDYVTSEARVQEARALASSNLAPAVEARLLMGEGRSAWRMSRIDPAIVALERALEQAPADDYETRIATLSMLEAMLPTKQRLDEAADVLSRAVALAESHDDRVHLTGTFLNSRMLFAARKDRARLLDAQRRTIALARETGMFFHEYAGEFNLGEVHYQLGELDDARRHIARAIEMETKYPDATGRPIARLLLARLEAFAGNADAARRLLDDVRAIVMKAVADGRPDGRLLPNEQGLFDVVELVVSDASPEAWDIVLPRARPTAFEHEPVELEELHALAALRLGRKNESRLALSLAHEAASRVVHLMDGRLASLGHQLTDPARA